MSLDIFKKYRKCSKILGVFCFALPVFASEFALLLYLINNEPIVARLSVLSKLYALKKSDNLRMRLGNLATRKIYRKVKQMIQ